MFLSDERERAVMLIPLYCNRILLSYYMKHGCIGISVVTECMGCTRLMIIMHMHRLELYTSRPLLPNTNQGYHTPSTFRFNPFLRGYGPMMHVSTLVVVVYCAGIA